jgi:hypothetical protein
MLDPRTGEAQAADGYVVGLDWREVAMSLAPPSGQNRIPYHNLRAEKYTYIVKSTPAGRRSRLARRRERLPRSFERCERTRLRLFGNRAKILYVISCNHRRPILCPPDSVQFPAERRPSAARQLGAVVVGLRAARRQKPTLTIGRYVI